MNPGENPPVSADPIDPLIDQVVADRYRVIRKLGEGGMGSVYLAEHVVIEKKLALKVLAPELSRRPDLVARFLQEARSASRIVHENVIDISDFGQSSDGYVYIAMEFLDGKDLGEIVRTVGALDWGKTREIVLQICRALRAAHDKGIVHRDMKPENIFLIHREGQPHFVKILDFGIAKVMGLDPNGPRLTRTGMIFGTPEYMAPEQAEGKDADHRVDIYAVGCILYHLMTGQPPFIADSFMTMLTKHLMEDPVAPSVRRPDLGITPDMDALVLKALQKDREQRWQSMAELLEVVLTCVGPQDQGKTGSRSETLQMGGANSPVVPLEPTRQGRDFQTEKIAKRLVQDSLSDEGRPDRPRRVNSNKHIFIAIGLAIGVGGAVWLAFFGEKSSSNPLDLTSPTSPSGSGTNVPVLLPEPPIPATALPEIVPSEKAPEENEKQQEPEYPVAIKGQTSGEGKPSLKPKSSKSAAKPGKADSPPAPNAGQQNSLSPTPKELKPFPTF